MQWTAGTWMLEYGRGFIPSTMPFALSDSFFSTQDLITVAKTFRICLISFLISVLLLEMLMQ